MPFLKLWKRSSGEEEECKGHSSINEKMLVF